MKNRFAGILLVTARLSRKGQHMRYKWTMLLVVAMLISAVLPAPTAAEAQLDSVLGVSWGATGEQVRQIMAKNNFAFSKEATDPVTGSLVRSFKGGLYAGYPAYIYVYSMDDQMCELHATLWADDIGDRLNFVFDDLNNLLTQKYGPKSRDESFHNGKVPVTVYVWSLDGNAKAIELSKIETFYAGKDKMLGNVSVTYKNVELRNALRNKSRQNI